MSLQPAILQNTVKHGRSVNWLSSAVQKTEHDQDANIDLVWLLFGLGVLELVRKEDLGQFALNVSER